MLDKTGRSPFLPAPVPDQPGKHKTRKVYEDPCAQEFAWAASLRPSTCGRPPGHQKLDQWLIITISTCPTPDGNEDNPFYCIIGSRILQRIIGMRYCNGDIELGRRVCLTDDMDIWVVNRADQDFLIAYLSQELAQLKKDWKDSLEFEIHVTDLHNSDQGIFQRSIKVTTSKPYLLLSSVDVTSPLTETAASTAHHTVRQKAQSTAIDTGQRLNRFVSKATRQPMVQSLCPMTGMCILNSPFTLSDTEYLESLREALDNETCIDKTYDKTCNTIRLLLYLEVTRRLFTAKQSVDPFCTKLIEIACAHLPQQHQSLKVLLPKIISEEDYSELPDCFHGDIAQPRAKKASLSAASQKQVYTRREKTHAIEIVDPHEETKAAPSWADVTKVTTPAEKPNTVPTIKSSAAAPGKQSYPIARKKKSKKKGHGTNGKPVTQVKTPPPQTYLTKEELTPELLLATSAKLDEAKSHEQQLSILFDAGVNLQLLETETADNPLAAMIVLQISKTRPKPQTVPKIAATPSPSAFPEPEQVIDTDQKTTKQVASVSQPEKVTATHKKASIHPYTHVKKMLAHCRVPPIRNQYPNESQLTDWLLSKDTDPPITAQADEDQINAFRQTGRLKQVLMSFHPVYHTGLFQWGNRPVIDLGEDACHNTQGLRRLREKPFKDCPYADYLDAVLYLKKGEGSHEQATRRLLKAATAGVTGAAIELIRLSLTKEKYAIPASVAMALLKHCVERPANRQYPLHFQVTPFRPPFSAENKIIMTIQQSLQCPMTSGNWMEMGTNLMSLVRALPEKRERCLLLSACTLNAAGLGDKALFCYEQMRRFQDLANLPQSCAFDWFTQLLTYQCASQMTTSFEPADIILHEPLNTWPPAMALQKILFGKNKDLDEAITAMREDPEQTTGLWCSWLPFCLPVHTDLTWMYKKDELKNYWEQLLKLRTVNCRGSVPVNQTEQRHSGFQTASPNPLHAEVVTPILESQYPQAPQELAAQFRELDSLLTCAICDEDSENEQPAPPVMVSCKKTAQALKLLGLKPDNPERMLFNLLNGEPENRTKAMKLLKEAIEKYANPYACWIYARLIRSEWIMDFPTATGRQAWYEKYLGLMVFAATMGVTDAADDLLSEAISGRADGLLITIAALIGRRYKQPARLQLHIKLPPIESNGTLNAFHRYDGGANHEKWCAHLHSVFKGAAEVNITTTHSIRMFWLSSLIRNFAPLADNTSFTAHMPIYVPNLNLPLELEVSIVTALEYFPAIPLNECMDAIRRGFTSPAKVLMGSMREHKALYKSLLTKYSPALLPWMQWQPGSTTVTGICQQMKMLLPMKSWHLAEHTLSNEYLMRLTWCSIIANTKTIPLPESSQRHMPEIAPWLVLHQSFDEKGLITLLTPSADITIRALNIRSMDKQLCAALSQDKTPDTDLTQPAALISPLVTKREGEGQFVLGKLNDRQTTIVTLLKLGQLENQNPSNPYPCLIKAFCHERKRGEIPKPEDIAQAGAELVHGAMLGSDCAVWHFTRLALQPDSPLSLERVIDLSLLQYLRTRRHTVHFDFPTVYQCSEEHREIIETIRDACLQYQTGKMSTFELICKSLIPALQQLDGNFESAETNCRLSLLLSVCYQKTGQNEAEGLFEPYKQSQLPPSLQQQWLMHRHLAYLKSLKDTGHTAARTVNLSGRSLSYRMLPYLPSTKISNSKQLNPFDKWHKRSGSWYELPAMMGHSELIAWQEAHCDRTFIYTFKNNSSTLYSIPGDKSLEHFRNILCEKYLDSLLNGAPLQFPYPENQEELDMEKFWYNQFRIDTDHLTNPPVTLARSAPQQPAPLARSESEPALSTYPQTPQRPASR